MTDFEIINELKDSLTLNYPPRISQERLDRLYLYCIKNNEKELAWRISLSYGNSTELSFEKIVNYYLKERDAYYLSELLYAVNGNIDLKQLYKNICNINDDDFKKEVEEVLKTYLCVKNNKELIEVIEKY